jgi:hypothetical protein
MHISNWWFLLSIYYLLHCLIEWLLFNIKWTVFRGVGVVQNVEVRFLKGTASVREASSISALWKVWESFKKQKSKKKILSLQTHPFTYSFKDQFDTFWLPCWTDGFSKFIDILYSDVVFFLFYILLSEQRIRKSKYIHPGVVVMRFKENSFQHFRNSWLYALGRINNDIIYFDVYFTDM